MEHAERQPRHISRVLATVTLVVGSLLLVPAVPPTSAAPAQVASAEPEWFEGSVDDFYVVPDPLPHGAPGELIRLQEVSSTATHVTLRIMYHSRDGLDRDRAVTGMITYPVAQAPEGGWPVLSIAHGTTGLGSKCAPSRWNRPVWNWNLPVIAVESDYIGMGPVGEVHAYMSRASEGNSVIDAVRAARDLDAVEASNRWLTLGGSQGGHGAQSAHELSAVHAPELELLGTVSMAPAAMFLNTYGGIDNLVARVVGVMGVAGVSTEHPTIDPADYASPAGLAAIEYAKSECTNEITLRVLSVPFDEFWDRDPMATQPAQAIINGNDVGHYRADAPLLLVQGTADTTVVPARTRDLNARLCRNGQVTEYVEVPGADHGNVGSRHSAEIRAWMNARLAGEPAISTCPTPVERPTVVPGAVAFPEGDDTSTMSVPVTLSAPSNQPVTVNWGTLHVPGLHLAQAEPGVDIEPTSGMVTFEPGEIRKVVEIPVHGNATPDPNRLVVVSFGGTTNANIGGFWGLGFGVIVDDD